MDPSLLCRSQSPGRSSHLQRYRHRYYHKVLLFIFMSLDVRSSIFSTGVHGPQIAEWVILTALVHSHSYNQLYESQKQHEWKRPDDGMSLKDLAGQKLGVLGYGSIGRQGESLL